MPPILARASAIYVPEVTTHGVEGKRIIVTGAGQGIGQGIAEVLAAVRAGGDTGALQAPVWAVPVDRLAKDVQAAVERMTAATTLSAFLDQDAAGDMQDGRL